GGCNSLVFGPPPPSGPPRGRAFPPPPPPGLAAAPAPGPPPGDAGVAGGGGRSLLRAPPPRGGPWCHGRGVDRPPATRHRAARQVAHGLVTDLVVAQLVLAEAPAPAIVEAEEQAAAGADELLQDQGVPAVLARRGLALRLLLGVDRQHLGERLGLVALRPPV